MFSRKPPIRFAEPGSDPTSESSSLMDAPKMSSWLIIGAIILAVMLIGGQIAYSNKDKNEAASGDLPTVAVLPSLTPTTPPSHTPRAVSTWTPLPTYTLYPTYTSHAPAATNAPILATWTPGAWLLTRAHATLHPATATPTATLTPEAAP